MKIKALTIFFIIIFGFVNVGLFAQITQPAEPVKANVDKVPSYIVHVAPKIEQKLQETKYLKKLKFAEVIEMDISPEFYGEWFVYGNKKIWRQKIISPGAYSLNLTFTKFQLKENVVLLIYNPSRTDVLGGLTFRNNKKDFVLATRPIKGDTIIVELQMPLDIDSYGKLVIGRMGHDFMNIYDVMKDGQYGRSGACNIDIACSDDENHSILKNSVCRIIFNNHELCTGTIINNTTQDGRPYILTANHCLSNETAANSAVFIFDYQSPFCSGPDGSVSKSISSSKLLATAERIDFSLVELTEEIPINYYPYYSGWNASEDYADLSNTYAIHHPWGDVKKISIDNDPPASSSYDDYYVDNSHWKVLKWDEGTTERGSSGGPLFDLNNRLIGDLTGGEADCYSPVNDYFTKFSKAWDHYADTSKQLKYWLDPVKANVTKIDGYDPNTSFKESCSKVSNYKSGEDMALKPIEGKTGYYTGHSELMINQFAEKFESEEDIVISGVFLNIAKLESDNPKNSKIKLKLWKGENYPDELLTEKTYLYNQLIENQEIFLEFDYLFNVKGTFFIGYEIFYYNPTDTFAAYHTNTKEENYTNTTFVFVNGEWSSLAEKFYWDFTSKLALSPCLCGEFNEEEIPPQKIVEPVISPNPSNGPVKIDFKNNLIKTIDIRIFDLKGLFILSKQLTTGDTACDIDLSGCNDGLYVCKIIVNQREFYKKIVVVH